MPLSVATQPPWRAVTTAPASAAPAAALVAIFPVAGWQLRERSGDELIARPYNDGHDGLGCALAAKLDRGPFVIRCAGNDKVIAAQREGDLILALRLRLVRGIIRRYDRPLGHLRRLVV